MDTSEELLEVSSADPAEEEHPGGVFYAFPDGVPFRLVGVLASLRGGVEIAACCDACKQHLTFSDDKWHAHYDDLFHGGRQRCDFCDMWERMPARADDLYRAGLFFL